MNEEYDAIVLGTGLKECILSGLLSVSKKKVLHLDRNDYYGAESASLDLEKLYKKAGITGAPDPKLGRARKYLIDQCPKFIMADGNLVKMLLGTTVTKYLSFKCVEGSFVYKDKKINEIPVTAKAIWDSKLMGMMQKKRFKSFMEWAMNVKKDDRSTWEKGKLDLQNQSVRDVFKYWKLEDTTMKFIGHTMALWPTDGYLDNPKLTIPTIEKIQLYVTSLMRHEKSPYIYPEYGLGGLPESFSRLAAVHGGTYMLRNPVKAIKYGGDGKVCAVETAEGVAKLKPGGHVIGDPSYFMDTLQQGKAKIKRVGRVARWICILDHPVPNTKDRKSAQIIIPAQPGKNSDIYVSVMSSDLKVTPEGFYTAMISSNVYTDNPKAELEIAYKLLGPVAKEFFFVSDRYMPINDPRKDHVFIPSSMDASTHFEAATVEVEQVYRLITGKPVDLSAKASDINKEADE